MTFPLFTVFCVFAGVTLLLALRRGLVVRFKADECLHLMDADAPLIEKQVTAARRLDKIDAWGIPLTVLTALLGAATYVAWWFGA